MNEIISKISSYNIFNYLLPGIIFSFLAQEYLGYSLIQSDTIIGLFLYYFIGLVISRIGSLVIDPALKGCKIICFAEYKDFVEASKKDEKIDLLSEVNNTYRTLCSTFFLLIALKGYQFIESKSCFLQEWSPAMLVFALLLLFALSYKKQTAYITRRVEANK